MHVAVLVILHDGQELLEIYPSEEEARSRLLAFVDDHWHSFLGQRAAPADPSARIELFFTGASRYLIARADLSAVSRRVDMEVGEPLDNRAAASPPRGRTR